MRARADSPARAPLAWRASVSQDVLGSLETRTLSFQLNLSLEQLLRPHAISTAQFGQLWSAHAAQRKFVVATKSIAQPQAYMQARARREAPSRRRATQPSPLTRRPPPFVHPQPQHFNPHRIPSDARR